MGRLTQPHKPRSIGPNVKLTTRLLLSRSPDYVKSVLQNLILNEAVAGRTRGQHAACCYVPPAGRLEMQSGTSDLWDNPLRVCINRKQCKPLTLRTFHRMSRMGFEVYNKSCCPDFILFRVILIHITHTAEMFVYQIPQNTTLGDCRNFNFFRCTTYFN